MGTYTVAITGASGTIYARRLLNYLLKEKHSVHCVVSEPGQRVMQLEEPLELSGDRNKDTAALKRWADVAADTKLRLYSRHDVAAPIASGSVHSDGMVIVPCSSGTLAKVANGVTGGLIERAAEVALKERRKLIMVPRETPLSIPYIENMLKISRAGAVVLPASPGFYNRPGNIEDLVDMVVARILGQLGIRSDLVKPWDGL